MTHVLQRRLSFVNFSFRWRFSVKMQFCMFHDRISAWNKMIAKFRWHYISVCSFIAGHDWKLADDNTIDYQWTSGCIFLQQLIDIMCASDTGLESESQNDDDTEQSTEVDYMIDVVHEDETDDEGNF